MGNIKHIHLGKKFNIELQPQDLENMVKISFYVPNTHENYVKLRNEKIPKSLEELPINNLNKNMIQYAVCEAIENSNLYGKVNDKYSFLDVYMIFYPTQSFFSFSVTNQNNFGETPDLEEIAKIDESVILSHEKRGRGVAIIKKVFPEVHYITQGGTYTEVIGMKKLE